MTHFVNVSVANIYKNGTYESEIINQVLLGEQVEVHSENDFFAFIKLENECEGWVSRFQLYKNQGENENKIKVISHFIQLFENPDLKSDPVRDAVIGCELTLEKEIGDWYQIKLPDGTLGWGQKIHFGEFPPYSAKNVIALAKQFLGYPYFWGGRSPKGFDCSGLTSTVYSLLGKKIRRNSYMQFEDCKFVSDNPFDAKKGDLYFLGDDKDMVDHVGIALGEGKIIHARGRVRINSFNENQPDFDKKLFDTFIAVSSIK